MLTRTKTADYEPLIEIRINCPNPWVGDAISARILNEHLAAAVNRVGAFSSYHWDGIEKSRDEIVLLAKTRASLFGAVAELADRMHPYEVPSITATDIVYTTEAYRAWVLSETRAAVVSAGINAAE